MTQILALMHDAAEAYFGDHIVALKAICPQLREIEAPIWEAIAERFYLAATEEEIQWVKGMDKRICNNEKSALMRAGQNWVIQSLEPLDIRGIVPRNPYVVEEEFLARAAYLGIGDTGRTL